ncbi:MAG: transcription-repair coupling factor [Waddliaceae bacterium]|nr:transcription-repair coupling factor [Waddliaceae bacterium]MBT3579438.1 transcription-repair coupling factor [Waddliaceae bacterium]MBT4445191.1 transcription-repair coupling factor [Waddliaceae bacterium]MBT6928144.1 transcription-repair coupling factor [Waddliaceae bacterium]MBT7264477.1 transcription-repair coupling factor [Waddliaceae bacterium]
MREDIIKSPRLNALHDIAAGASNIVAEKLWDSPKALIVAHTQKATSKNILVVTAKGQEENRILDDIEFFSDAIVQDFPSWEAMPSENIAPSSDVAGSRYTILHAISTEKRPHIVVTGIQALLQKVIHPEMLELMSMTISVGDKYVFDTFVGDLETIGYTRKIVASDKGEVAVRGGIVDIFPITSTEPCRIEFFDGEVVSIRTYDPVAQKSVGKIKRCLITPARELELIKQEDTLSTIVEYLGENTIVVFDDIAAIEDKYIAMEGVPRTVSKTFGRFKDFLNDIKSLQKIFFADDDIENLSDVSTINSTGKNLYSENNNSYGIRFSAFGTDFEAERWKHPFKTLGEHFAENANTEEFSGLELLNTLKSAETSTMTFVADTGADKKRFIQQLYDAGIESPSFIRGYLSQGFVVTDTGNAIIPHTEVTRRYKIRRQKIRSSYHSMPTEMYQLDEGDIVVHRNDGIGRYLGTERMRNNAGVDTEYLLIEYAEKARQYVPMAQSYLVSKYIGASETKPSLSTLGNARWKKIREKTEHSIIGYASELLDIYSKRSLTNGHVFPDDGDDVKAFEDDFPFVETEDQIAAINDVRNDMMSEKAMDRLICGDVGYGKTEVAMRAAFKAVDGGKQVAVLVPTTVLAMQHYDTFIERMCNFPINVAVMSRYNKAKENREIIQRVAEGTVDILIGTHRIISKDVAFKNLGLVIIDEEQRFGVKTKEKLRSAKVGVDCMAMSATPIPRTLYMSMIGTRDMSTVNTPPHDRLPIQTVVCEGLDDIMQAALLRELSRDGQAFVIHNRVETIYNMADRIQKLLPQARIIVAHGQMHADAINTAFHTFREGKADILLATTIVENGVDVPNANTIIVDRSDMFGLAALYQLRGRVGRWNRQAYAYFLVPNNTTELSQQRLEALIETGGYGGGMRIAMRDLEIRGAGDILGTEQSGHIEAIGFNLYCKMLRRTITSIKDKKAILIETKMECCYDARLPDGYINDPGLRMELYHRIGEATSWEETDAIFEEIKDRFGKLPIPAQWLYHLTRIRIAAAENSIATLNIQKQSLKATQQKGKIKTPKTAAFKEQNNPQNFENIVVDIIKELF